METLVKASKLDKNDPITALTFLALLRCVYDFNEVFERMASWVNQESIKAGMTTSLKVSGTFRRNWNVACPTNNFRTEHVTTYNYYMLLLLKRNVTNRINSKAKSKIMSLIKTASDLSVQFAKVLRTEMSRCGIIYPKKRANKISTDEIPSTIRSAVQVLSKHKRNAHMRESFHRAKVLLQKRFMVPRLI